jgi:Zn-dependent protease
VPSASIFGLLEQVNFAELLISMVVMLFSLSIHESAHAWTADRLGDYTGRHLGRVSLNPIVHIDPVGTILFPLIAALTNIPLLGWAKPVPVNPMHLKHPSRDQMYIAAAGPVVNVIAGIGFVVAVRVMGAGFGGGLYDDPVLAPLYQFAIVGVFINFALAAFNLIPIPPLDGSWIALGLLPYEMAQAYERLRPYGFILLLALLYTGMLNKILAPVFTLISLLLRP